MGGLPPQGTGGAGATPIPVPLPVDVIDRINRILGQLSFGGAIIDPRDIRHLNCIDDHPDICDRTNRVLGQLTDGTTAIDPRQIRPLTCTDDHPDICDRINRILGQLSFGGAIIDPRDRNWDLNFGTDQVDVTGSTISVTGAVTVTSTPIEKAVLHNIALPAIEINWFDAGITPTNTPTTFKIMVSTSTPIRFAAAITRGGNTQVVRFNGGSVLAADSLFTFDLLVHSGDSINFQRVTGAAPGTIQILRVQEIDFAVT